eukprot:3534101-Rhodomonas_salina.2
MAPWSDPTSQTHCCKLNAQLRFNAPRYKRLYSPSKEEVGFVPGETFARVSRFTWQFLKRK